MLILGLGLVGLLVGGELFVKGASRLALLLGMSPLLVGLTVVSFGTSSPELGVSLKASLDGLGNIAIGNVAGSNAFNILFILGFCALIAPLSIHRQLIRLDVPVMMATALIFWFLSWNGVLSRVEGGALLVLTVVYLSWLFRESKKEKKVSLSEVGEEKPRREFAEVAKVVLFVGLGLVLLYFGSQWTVTGAVGMAQAWGVSDRIIALTIVAAGTSLPELVTSAMATFKGQRDLAIGNVVGSNILNVLIIIGVSGLVSPSGIEVSESFRHVDIPFALAASVLCFPFFLKNKMNRPVGALFLSIYVIYVTWLCLF